MISEHILNSISYILKKMFTINFFLVIITSLIFSIGLMLLYSAAGGDMDPWASKQLIRFIFALLLFIIVSIVNIKIWLGAAYYIYFSSLVLLLLVAVIGEVGMGAQRWLDLGIFYLQPSELLKFTIILVLARYFHAEKNYNLWGNIKKFFIPIIFILIPSYLIFIQPDLGSSLLLLISSLTILFIIGLPRNNPTYPPTFPIKE